MLIKDADIRRELLSKLSAERRVAGGYKVVQEFALNHGRSRIDLATVGQELIGYEIKSDADNLDRLFQQMDTYNRVFDRLFLVVGECHIIDAIRVVPDWWGITLARFDRTERLQLHEIRKARPNQPANQDQLVRLLWRDEALDILADINRDRGVLSKPKADIYKRLTESLDRKKLQEFVRQAVCGRQSP